MSMVFLPLESTLCYISKAYWDPYRPAFEDRSHVQRTNTTKSLPHTFSIWRWNEKEAQENIMDDFLMELKKFSHTFRSVLHILPSVRNKSNFPKTAFVRAFLLLFSFVWFYLLATKVYVIKHQCIDLKVFPFQF